MTSKSIVFFHAHPDDEAIMTGGTMAKAASESHSVYLVTATHGSTDMSSRNAVSDMPQSRREEETAEAASILGVENVWFLGYRDSGMAGTTYNFNPDSFFQKDAFRAASIISEICEDVRADMLIGYEPNGSYGHPDHIKCHIVGTLAASKISRARFLWATLNRNNYEMLTLYGEKLEKEWSRRMTQNFWCEGDSITHKIDVTDFLNQKREAILCHKTEIDETHLLAKMTDEDFAVCFGTEWYAERDMKDDWRVSPEGEPVVYTTMF